MTKEKMGIKSTPINLFVRVNISVFKDQGLLKRLGPQRLQTLMALSFFMNENGYCYPSLNVLGKILGLSSASVSARIRSLVCFQFNGKPIVVVIKGTRNQRGLWQNNQYQILPNSGVAIFGQTTVLGGTETDLTDADKDFINNNY